MKNFITIKYIDALYYTSNKIVYENLSTHIAIGKLFSYSNDNIKIFFSEKNNKPESGLVLPLSTLIFDNNKNLKFKYFSIKRGETVGVYWNDITFFTNGRVPDSYTEMYTEAKIFDEKDDVIILKNPITLMLKNKIQNHPKTSATYAVIPKVMISDIQIYDK